MADSDGTHTDESEISNLKSQSAPRNVAATPAPARPAKLYHKGFGVRVDELHAFALAIADGKLTVEQLTPQLRPQLLQAVCALAGEIAHSRIPLVAIGPDWRFPSDANYLPPEPIETYANSAGPAPAAGRRSLLPWFAEAVFFAFGLAIGVAIGVGLGVAIRS